jgi:hypothetical protein
MNPTQFLACLLAVVLLAGRPATAATNELTRKLIQMGSERFFNTTPPNELIGNLKVSNEARQQILPLLFSHCFMERSMIFPEGILHLRKVVLEEVTTAEERGLFRTVADSGPNTLRLSCVEWIAGQQSIVTNANARLLVTDMMKSLATDTNSGILIRASVAALRLPASYVVPENLFLNTLTQALHSVQTFAADGKLTETRDILLKLRDVVDAQRIRKILGDQKYEAEATNALAVLWPFTTQDVVYESASWLLEKLNTTSINWKFYLRATDETQWGRSSLYDQRVIFINHPENLQNQVRTDCEAILKKWTWSFAGRNGSANHPSMQAGTDAFFQRNGFLLKLAAQYGYYDLVDRAAQHENKWYHELARMAGNAYPRKKVDRTP